MKTLLQNNWGSAFSEVFASIVGTLGIIVVISFILSLQADASNLQSTFSVYFSGGQLGLPILSLSGIIFIALRNHGPLHPITSLLLYILFLIPIIATAFMIGLNPGFQAAQLHSANLTLLWVFFIGLHVLWLLILLLEPTVPSAQEAAEAQESRVNKIKGGASGRA